MPDFTDSLRPAESSIELRNKERARSDIDVKQLAEHLLSRDGFLERQKRMLAIVEVQPVFSKKNQLNLSRPHRYHLGLARAKALRRLTVEHGWTKDDHTMAEYLVDEMSPYHLLPTMFSTSVKEQGNEAQKAKWLPLIESWSIIGAYAQTEMGHGSNVRGLELQARWDPSAKDFVLHSPHLTASKWWNGALGRTANHAIVVAQLMLPEAGGYKSYGPHQFILQIRDMKTGQPLDGVVIGDIGPKYGYASMDNGYMLFNHFRVPHSAMLARYAQVNPRTGAYTKPESPGVVYGSLTYVRANIIMHARLILARAVTIATRYTTVRRQFQDRDGSGNGPETVVLDYPTVQIRILPLLATTFALHYTGEAMYSLYHSTRAAIDKSGDFSGLAEMHAASSGLKSVCTTLAADGIETCRRAMGGHGFGGASGLIGLNADYLSKPTVEGDNWMITQQTASYLIKQMAEAVKQINDPKPVPIQQQYREFLILEQTKTPPNLDILGPDSDTALLHAFRHRASSLAHNIYTARITNQQPWTSLLIDLHTAAVAHAQYLLVLYFHRALFVPNTPPSPALSGPTQDVLKTCYRLFALFTIHTNLSSFLLTSSISLPSASHILPTIQSLMLAVRPHAVALVDAWSIPDYLLDSALGKYDGDVYTELFRRAHRADSNPLNREFFNADFRTEELVVGEGEESARKRLGEMVGEEVDGRWERAKL